MQTVGVYKNAAVTLELLTLGRGAQLGGAGLRERPLLFTRPPAGKTEGKQLSGRLRLAGSLHKTAILLFILCVEQLESTQRVNLPLITHVDKQAQHHCSQDRHVSQNVVASTFSLWGEFGCPGSRTGLPFGHVLHARPAGSAARLVQSGTRQNVQLLVCRQKGEKGEGKKKKNWRQGRFLRICTAEAHLGRSKF